MNDTNLNRAKILIVDDDVSHVCLLTNFLDRLGYRNLKTLTDSRRFFDELAIFQPDIVLLDLTMPHMSGFEILSCFKDSVPEDDFIPVLVLTGDLSPQNKRKALAAGATDLLQKPFDLSEIMMRIRNLVRSRFLRIEVQTHKLKFDEIVSARTAKLEQALTELKADHARLIQQERFKAFGQLSNGMAQDFNHLLSSLVEYSDLLLKDSDLIDDKKTVREFLELIHEAGRSATGIIDRVRGFYHSKGDQELWEELDLNPLLENVVSLTQPKWKDQALSLGRSIRVDLDLEKIPLIAANAPELREAVTHLICNAVDAMPLGGVISLRTRSVVEGVLFEVIDTGVGMNEEIKNRCLEPFFSTKGDGGAGLGLSMVLGCIHRHGGTLTIESRPGSGATFRIHLPSPLQKSAGIVKSEPALKILVEKEPLRLVETEKQD